MSGRLRTALLLLLGACSSSGDSVPNPAAPTEARTPKPPPSPCDADNGGITLPAGFCAAVFADNLGAARHIAVRTNGDVYVAIANRGGSTGGVIGLRDTDHDGRADQRSRFGDNGGNGVAYLDPYLYFAQDDRVVRYGFNQKNLGPAGGAATAGMATPAAPQYC